MFRFPKTLRQFIVPLIDNRINFWSFPFCRSFSKMSNINNRHFVAVCQLNSKEDKNANFEISQSIINDAALRGCKMVFLPECFDMICDSRQKTIESAEPIDGPIMTKYRQLAKDKRIWISLGGLHEKNADAPSGKIFNAHIVINDNGEIASIYRKLHLFNLEIPGVVRLVESEFSAAGSAVETPVETPVGRIGLGICYDLRFAEFAISLAKSGADILTYPSSFTVPTGLAHWETMLRTRAIETQCYVIAAAQIGTHNAKRSSYGHAMIIDPWGAVIAQCNDKPGYAIAEIDLEYIVEVRRKLPVWSDRKPEVYGEIIPASPKLTIEDIQQYYFGPSIAIESSQVFYRTRHSFAFVNHRPVLPGHSLISPLKNAKRLCDLSSSEIADLFTTVQRVQKAIETEYSAASSTIAIQDGPDAGQSVQHLHIHILPRKPTDFGGKIDQIYADLREHDKSEHSKKYPIKTSEEMSAEATKMRKYFK